MSERETGDASGLPSPLRTVTAPYGSRPNAEMDVIGWLIVLGMVVLLVPLVPLVLLGWLAWRFVRGVLNAAREESVAE